ncbi:hypothetical protein [Ammonifex thiophilus]|uniref:Uncharacterized protein n=1 Tax=Ammonifex thiophilus TaxID=444093 RepID=A0A3D8P6E0_9THEO|nr:hypothetical protein [Ammonifex thiophilus]RDV83924.1 hypothetical protein DXX99_03560 [Ammonifex thiophilus]
MGRQGACLPVSGMTERYGPEGFTEKAKKLLWPYRTYERNEYMRFRGVPRKLMLEIARMLPPGQMEDSQNNSPTFGELLAEELAVCYGGYVIGPPREDERVTLDEVFFPATTEGYRRALEVAARYGPDEVDVLEDQKLIRLWWD